MKKGGDLGGLGVGAIDEDQRSKLIGKSETPELAWIELPVCVAAHHSALPGAKFKRAAHRIRRIGNWYRGSERTNDLDRSLMIQHREFAVPVLPLFAQVNGIEQVCGRVLDPDVAYCPIVERQASAGGPMPAALG